MFGNGDEVNRGVGGSADSGIHGYGILEGLLGEDVRRLDVLANEVDDPIARLVSAGTSLPIGGWDGG